MIIKNPTVVLSSGGGATGLVPKDTKLIDVYYDNAMEKGAWGDFGSPSKNSVTFSNNYIQVEGAQAMDSSGTAIYCEALDENTIVVSYQQTSTSSGSSSKPVYILGMNEDTGNYEIKARGSVPAANYYGAIKKVNDTSFLIGGTSRVYYYTIDKETWSITRTELPASANGDGQYVCSILRISDERFVIISSVNKGYSGTATLLSFQEGTFSVLTTGAIPGLSSAKTAYISGTEVGGNQGILALHNSSSTGTTYVAVTVTGEELDTLSMAASSYSGYQKATPYRDSISKVPGEDGLAWVGRCYASSSSGTNYDSVQLVTINSAGTPVVTTTMTNFGSAPANPYYSIVGIPGTVRGFFLADVSASSGSSASGTFTIWGGKYLRGSSGSTSGTFTGYHRGVVSCAPADNKVITFVAGDNGLFYFETTYYNTFAPSTTNTYGQTNAANTPAGYAAVDATVGTVAKAYIMDF